MAAGGITIGGGRGGGGNGEKLFLVFFLNPGERKLELPKTPVVQRSGPGGLRRSSFCIP